MTTPVKTQLPTAVVSSDEARVADTYRGNVVTPGVSLIAGALGGAAEATVTVRSSS